MTYEQTPSQTAGPYFGVSMTPDALTKLVPVDDPRAIVLEGKVTDGAGEPVPDAMIEIWQADENGSYELSEFGGAGFTGFGRCHTDAEGGFRFTTLKPGPVPGLDGTMQAPHINVAVFGAGLLKPVRSRAYFPDEEPANRQDLALNRVADDRRGLLVSDTTSHGYRFDIRLQGDGETPFFDL